MAKVSGPLMSMSASGKLGNSLVFFPWKGYSVVREWLKPANPQTAKQGDRRIILGGTGLACGKINKESDFHQQLIDLNLIPSGQTKQSYLVSYIVSNLIYNATTYAAQLAAITGHTAYTSWQSAADTLQIPEFDLEYADIAPYDKALGLFLIAKAAIALSFVGSPYDTAITSWTATEINELVADFA